MELLISILSFLWQLPQNIIGWIVVSYFASEVSEGIYVWNDSTYTGSVSLGNYIILGAGRNRDTLRHETGHQTQSLMLGPLYLLVIGLPSIIWAGLWNIPSVASRLSDKGITYYDFYTEKWADELGHVFRG